MKPNIPRPFYLDRLLAARGNGLVKVVTGIRRAGKSHLLFRLFRERLREEGVPDARIVEIDLDHEGNEALRNPRALSAFLRSRIADSSERHYVLIDEIQLCYRVKASAVDERDVAPEDRDSLYVSFYDVLNEWMDRPNVDLYVTGSNSRMLSSDIATQFRGRGTEIRVHPLSFSECFAYCGGDKSDALDSYLSWGGLPQVVLEPDDTVRRSFLKNLFVGVYLRDILERNRLKEESAVSSVLDCLCSSVGSLSNPKRIADTLRSSGIASVSAPTVRKILDAFEDSFLFRRADRFDVKGRKFLHYPSKWYVEDVGLRNARMNFRQREPSHLMENVLFLELVRRGCSVDIGVVENVVRSAGGSQHRQPLEIDFVVNDGPEKVYIQSTWAMPDEEKRRQETASLRKIGDSFRKIVVTGGFEKPWKDEFGIETIGIVPFLLDPQSHLS